MELWLVISIIAVISVFLALISLRRQNKMGEIKRVKGELKKHKVIFHSSSSSS